MSLRGILGSAAGALSAGLRPPTPGAARAGAPARPGGGAASGGSPALARAGAAVADLQSLADQHLQLAGQAAAAEAGRWSLYGQGLQAAHDIVGDLPGQAQAAAALAGGDAVSGAPAVQAVLARAQQAVGGLGALSAATDAEVQARLARANDLLGQIAAFNRDVGAARLTGADPQAAKAAQAALAEQLANLTGATAVRRQDGGLDVRAADGTRLAGDTAAGLTYAAAPGAPARIGVAAAGEAPQPIRIDTGQVRGLLDLRNDKLPQMSAKLTQLGQAAGQALYDGPGASGAAAEGLASAARGFVSTLADDADEARGRQDAAAAVAAEAAGRRQRLAGLDVGQELASLAAYQQAASAAAQMSEGVRDLAQALAIAA